MNITRRTAFVFVCSFAALCCLAVFGWSALRGPGPRAVLKKIQALPADATAAELEQMGFLDLTRVRSGPVEEVNEFFSGQKQTLTFFTETEDGPVVQLLTFPDGNLLHVSAYFVRQQRLQTPNHVFACRLDGVAGENGVTEVWLRGTEPPEGGVPDWTDYLLYRYTDADETTPLS